ncbi:REP-associated tyrosine transposase [Sphaerotilaceae bacterium SBD11-9]
MARPLRIEFPGAVYHVTSRGDRREPIFADDEDRAMLLTVLARAAERFDAQVLAYCLMGSHYHLVLHTRQANLSLLMRHLNGVYTQAYNRRHDKSGHVFQGRFKAILVDRDAYLLALCRYVELNPVRAGMVAEPAAWRWSSYLAHVGEADSPEWLDTLGLHGYLLGHDARDARDHQEAARRYASLVASEPGLQIWHDGLRQQIYLGDEQFVERMQALMAAPREGDKQIPRKQRQAVKPLQDWLALSASREEGLYRAHTEGAITMTRIASALGLSVSQVSRLIARFERDDAKDKT